MTRCIVLTLLSALLLLVVTPAGARSPGAPVHQAMAQQATPVPGATAIASTTPQGPTTRGMVGPIIGIALVFMASAVGFGFALGLRRRINAIAGPDPEEEEDL